MIRINLLPEEFRVRKRRLRISVRWLYVVAPVVGLFLILSLLTLWQQSRLGRLEDEILQTKAEAERHKADLQLVQELAAVKEKVLQRMQAVEQLNRNRTRWIEILTALSQSVPGDMWLASFKEDRGDGRPRARVQGMSFSLMPIAFFMDNLDETQWFSSSQFTRAHRIFVPHGIAYDFEVLADLMDYERRAVTKKDSPQKDLKKDKKGKSKKS
jgi:Tfp pilus assembly protein PilN